MFLSNKPTLHPFTHNLTSLYIVNNRDYAIYPFNHCHVSKYISLQVLYNRVGR